MHFQNISDDFRDRVMINDQPHTLKMTAWPVAKAIYSRVSELLARFENYVYFAMNLALLNWS